MKNKILPSMVFFVLISYSGYSQDTTHHLAPQKTTIHKNIQPELKRETTYKYLYKIYKAPAKKPMYRDTRLGGSAKKYNTYKKNDNGAGAVTTHTK